LLARNAARVITYAGYILGFPNDSPASIEHDIEVIKRELPVDLLEFFYLTPLPGSEDHRRLVKAGTALDADLNKYDLNHVTTAHPRMSREEWERTYLTAWQRYYTIDHIQTVLRRVASVGANASNALFLITWFKGSVISRRSTRSNAVSFDARSVATDAPASRSSRPGASIRSTSAKPQRNWRGGVGYTCGCGASILVSSTIRSVSSTPTWQWRRLLATRLKHANCSAPQRRRLTLLKSAGWRRCGKAKRREWRRAAIAFSRKHLLGNNAR